MTATSKQRDHPVTSEQSCKTCLHSWMCLERDRQYPCREYEEIKVK